MTRFSQGLGRLTADKLNRLTENSAKVEAFDLGAAPRPARAFGPVPCEITGSAQMTAPASGKWLYSVKEIKFTTDRTTSEATNGWTCDNVVNLRELGNTTTEMDGVTVSELPGTFDLQPIPTGALVMVWFAGNTDETEDAQVFSAFFEQGSKFYGACT